MLGLLILLLTIVPAYVASRSTPNDAREIERQAPDDEDAIEEPRSEFLAVAIEAHIREVAVRHHIAPILVAAIVEAESEFNPRAVSRRGARGLMQLMPATAKPMADVRGLAFEDGGVLDNPRANLDIGTAFLAGLMKEFGDPRLAIAAYNAGPKRVRDWWKARRTGDMEAFVEQIPYDETRQYVKRVMLSWTEYRRLYGEVK